MTISSLLRRFEKLAVDNSPIILTTIGVVGTLTTAYLTGRATVKAVEVLSYAEKGERLGARSKIELKEKVKLVWKEYIPPFVTGALTVAAIVTSNRVSSRRAAALAVAYSISERTFEEYRAKIVEKLGPRKEEAARDEIAQEAFSKAQQNSREVLVAGNGEVLCYDLYTGRTFLSDVETMRQAQNDINHQIIHEMSASLTDFYYKIGLSSTAISDEVGWNVDRLLELRFTSVLTEQNKPAVAVGFHVSPIRNYHKIN